MTLPLLLSAWLGMACQRAASESGNLGSPQEIQLEVAGTTTTARTWVATDGGSLPGHGAGLLFVSGVDGGFIEPVDGIYDRLAADFARSGVHAIFVKYRNPGELDDSVADALAAAGWLRDQGVNRLVTVGWSFGGAVAITAATRIPEAVGMLGFSAQSRETEAIGFFRPGQSLLLFHSVQDENVPYWAAGQIIEEAPSGVSRRLVTLPAGDHQLDGLSGTVDPQAQNWIRSLILHP